MEIAYAHVNEKGKRKYQEDSLGVLRCADRALFALADGLGGHGLGDLASKTAVGIAMESFRMNFDPERYFDELFIHGNRRLCDLQEQRNAKHAVRTTLSCISIDPQGLRGAYVGDSRIYVFQKNRIVYRSLDHSVPQMLAAAGDIKEEEIRSHPDRNRLLRVLGDREKEIQGQRIPDFPLQDRTAVLICSDGFWENIVENEMERALKSAKTPKKWIYQMARLVKKRGKSKNQDNYSAIGIMISENHRRRKHGEKNGNHQM